MDQKVFHTLTYGLFVLSVNCYKKDNACIINTAIQAANSPDKVVFSVNKANFTAEMLDYTDNVTLSVISEDAPFSLFTRFGFQSGRDAEKFENFDGVKRCENGVLAVTEGTNAYLTAHVDEKIDLGRHVLVVATVTGGKVLSSVPSASYAYYHAHIKPKPQESTGGKTVWRCSVCGYEYEGDELPADFVCPLCKHPASDFERSAK